MRPPARDEIGAHVSAPQPSVRPRPDTCHLFAAGYDVRTPAGYAAAIDECAQAVGLERVLAFHLNDAKAALGSGLDRHEHIGRPAATGSS